MKKILKRFALFLLLTPVVLLVLVSIAYGIYALLAVGGESTPHQAYLQQYKQEVDLQATAPAFPIFDSAFYQKQIFFLGEAHGTAAPQALDFALLQHLNQRVGLRHYLAEVDYSQAYFLNQYLRTGEVRHLQTVFQFWAKQNAQWGNQNFYDKIKKIRTLNQTLPEANRIQILGVDKLQDLEATQSFLKETLAQLPQTTLQDSAFAKLQQIISADTLDTDALSSLASQMLPSLAKDSTSSLPAATKFDLQHTLQNIAYLDGKARRDSVMYLNLNIVVKAQHLEQAKLYGMWGLFHTLPVELQRGVPFAYYLQGKNSPFRGKTVSIGVYTIDSENMMPAASLPAFLSKGQRYVNSTMANNDGPMVFVNGIKDLRAASRENSITLFKTDAPGSPYRTSSRLASIKVLFPNQSIDFAGEHPRITQVFQYVCLVRNSPALTPLPLL
ncbi:TraB/GumN family protein [Rufibacter hautae]|uniref:Erythromycin esterase family protein n=1 Tax=Rufibacter hautae TaxID=2595005 RepID=A0A5B6TMM4_9BACT|nr:erythromycin esterase family protein [Rufibacter hautae]KAA3440595.1 erythromycin esterase family protein [Rufibacter hautae]